MHMQGEPRTMQDAPRYDDVVAEVIAFLRERVERRRARRRRRASGSWSTRASASARPSSTTSSCSRAWTSSSLLGLPILIGTSRKSFLGRLTGRGEDERLAATIATNVIALLRGASVFRVHDVAAVA